MSCVDRAANSNNKKKMEYATTNEEHILQARRQLLRERDPELRALVQRLQSQYIGKELEKQIVENRYRKLRVQIDNINNDEIINDSVSNDADVQTEQAEINKKIRYGRELKQQIQMLRQQRREEHQRDAINDKNMVDGIVRAIQEQDARQMQEMRDKKHESQKEMVLFIENQKHLKERQKIILAEEEKFLEEQQMQIQDRGNNIFSEKQRKLGIQDAINKKVIDKMLAEKAAKEEREELVRHLVEHEHEERTMQQESRDRQKSLEMNKYNQQMLKAQMQRTALLNIQQAQQNHLYSQQLAEEARAEQNKKVVEMSKVRATNADYANCLLLQIQANRRSRQTDRQDHADRNASVVTHHNQWKKEVGEEKRRLLEEYRMLSCQQASNTQT